MIYIGDIWRFEDGDVFVFAIDDKWIYYIYDSKGGMICDSRHKDNFTEKAEFVENVYQAQSYEHAKTAKPKKLDLLKRIAKEILR